MKKLCIIFACLLMTASVSAESHKFYKKLKGFENKTVRYVESNPKKDFDKITSYAKYAMTNDITGCFFTKEETSWFYEQVENSSEYSWYRYFDKAWDKYNYAHQAFGSEYLSKNDKKKADKLIREGTTSLVYGMHIFNAGEIILNGKPNSVCIQWEFFNYTDENGKEHILWVWQGSKKNNPKDFITYLD